MKEAEQQRVGRAVNVEVVEHGIDPLDRRIDPRLDGAQEVDPVGCGATLIRLRQCRAGRRLKGTKDIAGAPAPAVINLLLGALSLGARWPHELLAGIALARLRCVFRRMSATGSE